MKILHSHLLIRYENFIPLTKQVIKDTDYCLTFKNASSDKQLNSKFDGILHHQVRKLTHF